MNFVDFFKDRLFYTITYFGGITLTILIMVFSIKLGGVKVPVDNIIYIYFLAIIFYIIAMLYEYFKSINFYRKLTDILESEDAIEEAADVGKGNTAEQVLFINVLKKMHREYARELYKVQDLEKQNVTFTSQWVHQMKTPVSVINLLLQEECNEQDKAIFESIREENEKISQGLNIMLYNSRINQFNHDFNVEEINLIEIIRKVINDNKKTLIKKRIFPQIIGESTLVQTDKKWIYFIVSQIVINAIKYTDIAEREKKYIKFIIKDEEEKIKVCIKDNGIGIPKEDVDRVFNEFFTGKNGRKSAESTGMGLYLSRLICREMGHEIEVQSTEGQGAEFIIIFYKEKNIFKIKA